MTLPVEVISRMGPTTEASMSFQKAAKAVMELSTDPSYVVPSQ